MFLKPEEIRQYRLIASISTFSRHGKVEWMGASANIAPEPNGTGFENNRATRYFYTENLPEFVEHLKGWVRGPFALWLCGHDAVHHEGREDDDDEPREAAVIAFRRVDISDVAGRDNQDTSVKLASVSPSGVVKYWFDRETVTMPQADLIRP